MGCVWGGRGLILAAMHLKPPLEETLVATPLRAVVCSCVSCCWYTVCWSEIP